MRKLFFILFTVLLCIPMYAQQAAPNNMQQYRGNNGHTYTFKVTGSRDGRLWGGSENVYTDDSSLGIAAVHAGLVRPGETAVIHVTIMAGRSSYPKITRNGITSRSYGSYYGSYKLSGKNISTPQRPSNNITDAPHDMTKYRGNNGHTYTFKVTGSRDGRLWGGSDNVYTDDSSLGIAAVHAGLVRPGKTAVIHVTIMAGRNSYPKITRNGITSRSYGSYYGSYKLSGKFISSQSPYSDIPDAPHNMTKYREQNGKTFTFKVTGTTNGRIWGGQGNVYTDDSAISTAAVHAGLIRTGETAIVKLTIMAGRNSYPQITRNGITSRSYGSYYGSYIISLVKRL